MVKENLPTTKKTWSIAQVAQESGLGKDTLRVWERRYGFPLPLRDQCGERTYPDQQVHRLCLLKRLLDAGHRPGQVVILSMGQLQSLVQALAEADIRSASKSGAGAATALGDAHECLQWLLSDRTQLLRHALQQHILGQGLGHAVDRLVAPLCVLVGQSWMRGELSVYQEHLFTQTLQSVLRESIASVDTSGRSMQHSPRVLLTTTPNELHGLGLLMAECHFALQSCVRFVLGTSTPVADILLAARKLKIDVLALSFSAHATRRYVLDSLHQLLDQLPLRVQIWVGGAGAVACKASLPESVVLLDKPGDIATQVQTWRRTARRKPGLTRRLVP